MLQAAAFAALGVIPINRKAFMTELRNLLAFMDEEDRERVLRRYERIFDAAGADGEEKLIRSLGSPVRQVLDVEREYTRAKAEGKTPFLDADEPVSGENKDFSALVREAADALKGADGEKTLFPSAGKEAEDAFDQLPIEELPLPGLLEDEAPGETVIPDMEESAPEDEPEEKPAQPQPEPDTAPEEEAVPAESSEEVPEAAAAEGPAEAEETPAAEAAVPAEEQGDSEPLTPIYDETAETPAQPVKATEPEKPAEPDPEETAGPEEPASPGFGRILAAVVVTIPFLLWWGAGFAVSLALGAVILAVGFAVCVGGVYLGGYAVSGGMTFMPDRLLVGGAALACFAAALLLIWMGLWIVVGGIALVIRTSARVYRKILGRPETEEENDG